MLAGIGLPLYKAQQDKAEKAVLRNNLYTIQKSISSASVLGAIKGTEILSYIKIKGDTLHASCLSAINSGKKNNAVLTGTGGTSASVISENADVWCVQIDAATSCTMFESNGCIDSAGNITQDGTCDVATAGANSNTAATGADCSGGTSLK